MVVVVVVDVISVVFVVAAIVVVVVGRRQTWMVPFHDCSRGADAGSIRVGTLIVLDLTKDKQKTRKIQATEKQRTVERQAIDKRKTSNR